MTHNMGVLRNCCRIMCRDVIFFWREESLVYWRDWRIDFFLVSLLGRGTVRIFCLTSIVLNGKFNSQTQRKHVCASWRCRNFTPTKHIWLLSMHRP